MSELASAALQQTPPSTPAPTPPPVVTALPSPAMMRSDPKIKDVRLEVTLYGSEAANPTARQLDQQGNAARRPPFQLISGAHLAIPLISRTSWCDTDFRAAAVSLFVNARETKLDPGSVYRKTRPGIEALLDIPVASSGTVGYNDVRAQVLFKVQLWELTVDENIAARATWPRSWGADLERYLGSDEFINPADAAIKACAEASTAGGARSVTPFYAARNAVLAILAQWNSMQGGTSEIGPDSSLRGMQTSDGVFAIGAGRGSPVELAVTCVAAVRAIGIPARVVYCLQLDNNSRRSDARNNSPNSGPTEFRYICEFALKDVGWVPFDPMEIRGQGVAPRFKNGTLPAGPIEGFANVPDIEDALPWALRPIPEGYQRADRIACWGWSAPGARVDTNYATSRVYLNFTGRGNGTTPKMPAPASDDGG